MNLFIALLAGGSGTRFWPASTREVPKQFLPLTGGEPLLRETYDRIAPLARPERIAVVTSARHAEQTRSLLPELPHGNVIGEPSGRNTAAACAVAAHWAQAADPEAVVVMLPADHVIAPVDEFRAKLVAAAEHARGGSLVTLGLEPTYAATGYGWIRLGQEIRSPSGHVVHRVAAFVEKPEAHRAEQFLKDGGHLWNLGMFAWRADAFLLELTRLQPQVAERAALVHASIERAYDGMPSISVDKAVLERAARVDCLPCSFRWDDVGSFVALQRHLTPDADGNTAVGPLVALDATNCITYAADGRLTALLGVEDLIVVHVQGVTLVAHRSRAEDVKQLVDRLGPAGLDRYA